MNVTFIAFNGALYDLLQYGSLLVMSDAPLFGHSFSPTKSPRSYDFADYTNRNLGKLRQWKTTDNILFAWLGSLLAAGWLVVWLVGSENESRSPQVSASAGAIREQQQQPVTVVGGVQARLCSPVYDINENSADQGRWYHSQRGGSLLVIPHPCCCLSWLHSCGGVFRKSQ